MAEPTYQFYRNTYLDTHQKLIQQSIMMAQSEFDSKLKQIQFYEKQLAKMKYGTDGTGAKFQDRATLQYRSKSDARKLREDKEKAVEAEGQLDTNFVSVESNIKSLIGGGKSPEAAVKQVISEMQLNKAGSSDYQRRLIAQRLVQVTGSAARAKGQKPSAAGVNQAIETGMGIGGFQISADKLKEQEIARRQAGIEEIPVPGSRYTGGKGKQTNLDFSMDQVNEDESGLFFIEEPKKKGGKPVRVPLTVEQERVYRLQAKIRKLETNLEEDYGEDYSIDTIIEKGRDIYRRNYAPISQSDLNDIYRENFMEKLSEKQKGLFLAYESVDSNDKRIKKYMRGNYDKEDQFYSVVDQIISAKKQGQMVDPMQLAMSVLNDEELAKQAVGVVLQAQIQMMEGKEVKPSKEQKEKSDTAKQKKKEVKTSMDEGEKWYEDMEFGGLAKIRDGAANAWEGLFSGRMKDEVEEEVETEPEGLSPTDAEEMVPEEIPAEPVVVPFEAVDGKLPSWATSAGNVMIIAPGTYRVESTSYGSFTIGPDGKVIDGKIKKGDGAGWLEGLDAANK